MISVIIPLYNKAPHIVRTIESVLAQTVLPAEIIVVDDGSTDGGPELLIPYESQKVIRLIRQKNSGESAARNRGIAEAENDYVAFLDADDYWLPSHIEVVMRLIAKFPQAALLSTAHFIERGGLKYRPRSSYSDGWMGLVDDFFCRYAKGLSLINSITACARKVELVSVGGFPVGVRRGPDIICWVNMALKYPVAHAEVRTAVYFQDAVNRSDRLREADPPGSLMHIAMLLKDRGIDDKTKKGLALLYDRIAFFTAAGFMANGDVIGMRAIRDLSWEAGRYRSAMMVAGLKWVPQKVLLAAKKIRHSRVSMDVELADK